ncbi:hypothetical protein TNCT_556051 [Trichonephila clavata]|uniref:Uncharacterized protein n=1 Tax=Trichonephila clavata TaxID=2740835 RepID=A0A8X6GVR6_TRICU|nr:hypothetical protein TNCT_556051 [Trichonephila clavata]
MLPPRKTRCSNSDFGIQFVPKDKISHRASIIIKAGLRERGERVSPKLFYISYQTFQKEETFRMTSEKTGKTSSREVRSKRKILSQKSGDREKLHSSIACNPVSHRRRANDA